MRFDTNTILDQFRLAIEARGINPPAKIIADGQYHRADANGRKGKLGARYRLYMDGVPAGGFENFYDDRGWENWKATVEDVRTPAEKARDAAELAEKRRKRAEEARDDKAAAKRRAEGIWYYTEAATPAHPYLVRKQVRAVGLGLYKGALVVPMRDIEGEIHSLQFIAENGTKRYLKNGRVEGCFFGLGEPGPTLYVVEGYATAATIHEATEMGVAVAFDSGNLLPVARALRQRYPDRQIVFGADDDVLNILRDKPLPNAGLIASYEAARAVDAMVAMPHFPAYSESDLRSGRSVRASVFRRIASRASLDPSARFYERGLLPFIDHYVDEHASALAALSTLDDLTWGTIIIHLRDTGMLTDETDFNDMRRMMGIDAVRDRIGRPVPAPSSDVQDLYFDIEI